MSRGTSDEAATNRSNQAFMQSNAARTMFGGASNSSHVPDAAISGLCVPAAWWFQSFRVFSGWVVHE